MIYSQTDKTIETNKLLLRLFKETDAPEVTRLCNNYNLYKNTLYLPYPYSIEDVVSWINNKIFITLMIISILNLLLPIRLQERYTEQ